MNLTLRVAEWAAPMPRTDKGSLRARVLGDVFWALVMLFIISILAFCIIIVAPEPHRWY